MTELGWEQVRAWRVRRHALAERAPDGDMLEVVSRLCESLREKLGQGFGAYLKPAAFRGRLCFGPSDGQLIRFTRPDAWLGHAIERPEPCALGALIVRG